MLTFGSGADKQYFGSGTNITGKSCTPICTENSKINLKIRQTIADADLKDLETIYKISKTLQFLGMHSLHYEFSFCRTYGASSITID